MCHMVHRLLLLSFSHQEGAYAQQDKGIYTNLMYLCIAFRCYLETSRCRVARLL